MDAGDWIALCSGVVAVIAMFVSLRQAAEAKKSRQAAEQQVQLSNDTLTETRAQTKSAKESATSAYLSVDAAEKAANAAEAQVTLAREQADIAREQVLIAREQQDQEKIARDAQAAPDFLVAPRRRKSGVHPVFVTRTSDPGPEVVEVHATWIGISESAESEEAIYGSTAEIVGGVQADSSGPHRMVRGSSFEIGVAVGLPDSTVVVEFTFACKEVGGENRTWTRSESVSLKRPPGATVY